MGDKFSVLSENQLREYLARWTVTNSRFAPTKNSSGEAAFIFEYTVPKTRFELIANEINQDEKILSTFKTEIKISSWQSRDEKEHRAVYLKLMLTDVDSLGNLFSFTHGYSILDIY